jgi:hypothetical protein
MSAPAPRTTIALVGAGPDADRWSRALRGVDGVEIVRTADLSGDDFLESLSQPAVSAVAFAAPVADLPGAIRRVAMTNRHVLVAGNVALASRQFAALDDVAHRRGRTVLFETSALAGEHFAFLRKMIAGPNALWRPRYIRSLHTGAMGQRTLDEAALHDVTTVLSLSGGMPAAVSAWAPRVDDESGSDDVAMLTLAFDGGRVARIDVSLLEPQPRSEIVVACEGRTMVIESADGATTLRIHAAGRHRGPQRGAGWAETVTEYPVANAAPAETRVAEAFVAAVRRGGAEATNAGALARAALVWETARMSISRGGEALPLPVSSGLVEPRRPALQLIHGGGHTTQGAPPELTVVGRR